MTELPNSSARDDPVVACLLDCLKDQTSAERAVFIMTSGFGYSESAVGRSLGLEPGAVRRLAESAKERLTSGRSLKGRQFLELCRAGDLSGVERMLTPDATLWIDDERTNVRGSAQIALLVASLVHPATGLVVLDLADGEDLISGIRLAQVPQEH